LKKISREIKSSKLLVCEKTKKKGERNRGGLKSLYVFIKNRESSKWEMRGELRLEELKRKQKDARGGRKRIIKNWRFRPRVGEYENSMKITWDTREKRRIRKRAGTESRAWQVALTLNDEGKPKVWVALVPQRAMTEWGGKPVPGALKKSEKICAGGL